MNPHIHKLISSHATSLYETCTGRVISKELSDAFAQASVDEDHLGLTRLLNWHFYYNGGRILRYWMFIFYCNGSNEHIFKKRLETLDGLLKSKAPNIEIYKIAGRVAHHIQDMSSPPHAMPVFHTIYDKFDSYIPAPFVIPDITSIRKDVSVTVCNPHDLLEQAAQKTLKAVIENVIFDDGKTIENETWMKFWGGPEDNKRSGFKTYGEYGNAFGIIPPGESPACHSYTRNTFDSFYTERYMRAVKDTISLLIYVDQQNTGLKRF